MEKKRDTCQEVLTWRKTSSTLLSRPSCHLQPTFMRLHGVPLFPGQERSRRPLTRGAPPTAYSGPSFTPLNRKFLSGKTSI